MVLIGVGDDKSGTARAVRYAVSEEVVNNFSMASLSAANRRACALPLLCWAEFSGGGWWLFGVLRLVFLGDVVLIGGWR